MTRIMVLREVLGRLLHMRTTLLCWVRLVRPSMYWLEPIQRTQRVLLAMQLYVVRGAAPRMPDWYGNVTQRITDVCSRVLPSLLPVSTRIISISKGLVLLH